MKKYLLALSIILYCAFVSAQNPVAIPDTLSGNVIDLTLQTGSVNFRSGAATSTMGVNGNILGPTLIFQKHQQVTINVNNQLGEPTTIHWHGMHVSPENDGGPHIIIPPGTTWSPSFEVLDWASTHWYHPHLHHHTNEHVQKGVAGFIITRDVDEAAINLPRTYGVDDFPLVVQTKALDINNQIVVLSALDSMLLVNGTMNPYLDAPAQVVRMRLLNGSSERYYNFGFTGNRNFYQIAGDASLLEAPVALTRLMLSPGERAEIIIDLAPDAGQSFHLMSYGSELPNAIYGAGQPGMGAGQSIPNYNLNPLNGSNFNIMQINVVAPTANPVSTIPTALINHNPWQINQAVLTRQFVFSLVNMGGGNVLQGPFYINNALFDMNVINFSTSLDNVEIWELRNQTPIGHPFHLHAFPFYILDINGVAPPANMRGRKDVVHVPAGNGVVRFITRFEDFTNDSLPYMYHCHILTHEDDGMMGQFLVTQPCLLSFSSQPVNVTVASGAQAQFVAVANDIDAAYRWQTDIGFGFQNISNAGQYSGADSEILTVSNVALSNNNQLFRCMITSGSCSDTSDLATLIVDNNMTINETGNKNGILVFPNPTTNQVNIIIERKLIGTMYSLFDRIGILIEKGTFKGLNNTLDISGLPSGIYLIKMEDGSSNKFIKQF